ncbi:hypothetical protein JRO89_XS12G0049600 [Xanthoceras sorbifolium]|uniref:Protein kinase domain-containing protein n=1 Tax=Xanthoceras sorbifolium TaxID=99658 RepID=A0ABQ8HB92_9ROSI|nr:hypothetical protein JRO89_XS12G0049600 [Xanthoceras sorbifolium]
MSPLLISVMVILSCTRSLMPLKICPNCGHIAVPYPLSTGPDCGDQLYKVRCNAGLLWLDALNGSSYMITSINPLNQQLIIRPPGFTNNACIAADYGSQGIELNSNLRFNISGSNTVLILNCSNDILTKPYNCSSSSICHSYIRDNAVAQAACGNLPICCWLKTGGSVNEYRIRVREGRCAAYLSFVNLDMNLPVSKWPEPGVEIDWAFPQEPVCNALRDCKDLLNSMCLPDPASLVQKRCLCKAGFQWDPINGICQSLKCSNRRGCKHRKSKTPVMGGLAIAGVTLLLGIILVTVKVYKQSHHSNKEIEFSLMRAQKDISKANNSGRLARIYNSKEIKKATNNFSSDNLVGSGGFGEVFKGILDDGTITAVKRAKPGNTKGIDQILNEVRILCQLNHRSLVKLLGCCIELEQPLLVYEFIPNGTLFDHLHRARSGKWPPLTWHHRLHIAHQTAQALAYLHLLATPPIYHRDIKSSNILLNEKLDAKVSDFGLSRLAVSDASHVTTCAQGTLGYLDPEYYLNFQLTDKSDIYSFGVVLVELLTSKKAVDFNREETEVNLVVYYGKILKEERLMDVIDPMLKEGASKMELQIMEAFGLLAASCLEERRQNRPSIKEVADEIERIISVLTSAQIKLDT